MAPLMGGDQQRRRRQRPPASASVRQVLVESALTAIPLPGPLRAFYERIRARRGHPIAIVATA
jgi:transposase